jgi:lipopolysaccharide/colanic/teichoic acid biosynthesis glycosyltransferase
MFKQKRIGKNKSEFNILKVRTGLELNVIPKNDNINSAIEI